MLTLILSASDIPPAGFEEGLLYDIWLNLIKADRYMLILKGLAATVQIAVMAVILGIIIGFFVALMKLSPFAPLRGLALVYIQVIRGIPMVVQLMIIYFVVLASSSMPKIAIAAIAFGINSGAYVAEIFRAGILSVDKGQIEAGRSLGMNGRQTMMRIVLPQAVKTALPSLGNEFILLFKETAVVGYIGLEDLTKAGDIIRSRTFDAWVPLLFVAVIYLVIVIVLSWLLGILERRLRRSDTR